MALRLIVAISCSLSSLMSQAQPDAVCLRKDLDSFRYTIEQHHADPFRHISKKDFRSGIDSLKQYACNSSDDWYVGLLRLAARLKDEHLFLRRQESIFPYRLQLFREGLYLTHAKAGQDIRLSKVLRIGRYAADSALGLMKPFMPTGNSSEFNYRAPEYLSSPTLLFGTGITARRDSVQLLLELPDGSSVLQTFTLTDRSEWENPEAQNGLKDAGNRGNYWYDIILPQRALYFNYLKCKEDPNRPFSALYFEMIPRLEKYQVQKAIIDMRRNGGGSDYVLFQLISYLAARQKKDSMKVYVLIGRNTFSAAVNNAVQLSNEVQVSFVGEETGGNINHFGHRKDFRLPCTDLWASFSRRYFTRRKGATGGVKPDVLIPESVEDLRKGHDPVLDYALNH